MKITKETRHIRPRRSPRPGICCLCGGQTGPYRWPGCPADGARPRTLGAAAGSASPGRMPVAVSGGLPAAGRHARRPARIRSNDGAPAQGVGVPFSATAVCTHQLCIASESSPQASVSIASITVPCLSLLPPWRCKPSRMAAAAVCTMLAYPDLLTQPVTDRAPVRQIEAGDSPAVPDIMHRGGVLEAASVRATLRFGADNATRFSNIAIRCAECCDSGPLSYLMVMNLCRASCQ